MPAEPGSLVPGREAGVEVFTSSEQGFPVTGLRGPRSELKMVPALGGRLISLRSLTTGRDWAWHQPRPDWLWANVQGDAFSASPQAGLDECVPTVAACSWKGRDLPDHGEVWFQDWSLEAEALARKELKATLVLPVSPFRFSRSISVGADGAFVFAYSLTNTGHEAEPYLWSLHPLLDLRPGDCLDLGAEVHALHLNGGLGAPIRFGDTWAYPEPMPGIRLDQCQVPGMPGGCVKGFAGPLATGQAAVANPSGDRLEFRWKAAEVPFLGIWLNRGHGGFHHLALEPASGAPDALADAVSVWKQARVVPAGATVRWCITLDIS